MARSWHHDVDRPRTLALTTPGVDAADTLDSVGSVETAETVTVECTVSVL
jgi:hypothetical protein